MNFGCGFMATSRLLHHVFAWCLPDELVSMALVRSIQGNMRSSCLVAL
jgi:hypothetical protein